MKRPFPLHPLLMAAYPVLFLYGINQIHFPVTIIFLPLIFLLLATLAAWALLCLVFRSMYKAGLLTTLLLFIVFSHVAVRTLLKTLEFRILGHLVGANEMLLILWLILAAGVIAALFRTKSSPDGWTKTVNVVTLFLVVFSIGKIGLSAIRNGSFQKHGTAEVTEEPVKVSPRYDCDIYYIILDGYARADILEKVYHFDNRPFLDFLADHGFKVAAGINSNYIQTILSMASSLNFTYLDDLKDMPTTDRQPAVRMIQDNRLFRMLREAGYEIVTFASGYYGTEIRKSDLFLKPSHGNRWMSLHLNEFQNGLLRMTLFPLLSSRLFSKKVDFAAQHRNLTLYILNRLREIPGWKGERNRFVFSHIVCPHPPFVLNERGESLQPPGEEDFNDGSHLVKGSFSTDDYKRGYLGQLRFINEQMEEIIRGILEESKKPAIIILQADHGPGSGLNWEDPQQSLLSERFSILNAYHFPREGAEEIPDGITPANSFRLVLNHLFDSQLPLLENRSYFSKWSNPYGFIDVTEEVRPGR